MVNPVKKMSKVDKIDRDTMRAVEAMSSETKLIKTAADTRDAFMCACRMFNELRDILSQFKMPIYDAVNKAAAMTANIRAARGVNVDNYVLSMCAEDSEPLTDVEDGEKFLIRIEELSAERDPLKLMRNARKLKIGIDAALARWEDKLLKIKDAMSRMEQSNAMFAAYESKAVAFGEMVKAIKTRRDTLMAIFGDAKNKVERFLERETESFANKTKERKLKLAI